MSYEFLEHTADVRARCRGVSIAELYEAAAEALYGVAFEARPERSDIERQVTVEGATPEETMVRWLQELIFLMESKRFAARVFEFQEASGARVKALLRGGLYRPEQRAEEIKGATYHGMSVRETGEGYEAEVLFDL